jgi:hypothetical protein
VAPIYESFKFKGLEVIWIFSEDKNAEPVDIGYVNHFVNNAVATVSFPVLRDPGFAAIFDVLPGEGTLPVQFLIDPRDMTLQYVAPNSSAIAYDILSDLMGEQL